MKVRKDPEILVPLSKQLQGQAKNILKGAGLGLLKPKLFNVDIARIAVEEESYKELEGIGYDKIGEVFGLPVWDLLVLRSPRIIDEDENGTQDQIDLSLEIALIEIRNPRNIIRTKVAGRNGDIIEYMSNGNWEVKIRGVLSSKYENTPPKDLLRKFIKLVTTPAPIDVESNLLNFIGIYSVVILEPFLKQREGVRNVYDFELDCISDTPNELDLDA